MSRTNLRKTKTRTRAAEHHAGLDTKDANMGPDGTALPEADRLEGFPHPRETRALYGHEAAERAIAQAFLQGAMHHAWLITGPEGIGKATLAYRIARFVLAGSDERADDAEEVSATKGTSEANDARAPGGAGANPSHNEVEASPARGATRAASLAISPDSATARQVMALSHPSLMVIRRPYDATRKRFAAAIPVDEVRRLRGFLGLTAGGGGWRVVIVDRADEMNINAANALLKSLEEPPERCLFLLVSARPGRLLPTIRSRCRLLALVPLDDGALARAAHAAAEAAGVTLPEGEDWQHALALADGSVRRLLALCQNDGMACYRDLLALVASLPALDRALVLRLADRAEGPAGEPHFELFFSLLGSLIARLVRQAIRGSGAIGEEAELAARLIGPAGGGPADGLARWAELWEIIQREKATAEAYNLDRRTLVLETCLRLEAVAAGTSSA